MRAMAAVGAVAAAIVLQPDSGEVHTVVQQDRWRTAHEPPSASVSADGRYIALATFARLSAADTDDRSDIYVVDRINAQVWFESPSPATQPQPCDNAHPRLSADASVLVYQRSRGNGSEIVVRNRLEPSDVVIPNGRLGPSFNSNPEISRNGRVVVFSSTATDLVDGTDANGSGQDVYLFDLVSGAIERVSVSATGMQSSAGVSVAATVSGDGRLVAFSSTAELSPEPRQPADTARRRWHVVYLFDRERKSLRLISRGRKGEAADGASWWPAISADGRFVAFVSAATNLVANDRNRSLDVFVADLVTGEIELVSGTPAGASANGRSIAPAISDDGQVVAFQSEASDMLCDRQCGAASEDFNLLWDVFIRNRQDRSIRRLSRDATRGWMEPSEAPAVDASGRVVAFSSRHPMDAADRGNDFDLFICSAAGAPGPKASRPAAR
jgi:Tol biopolymer transport system component